MPPSPARAGRHGDHVPDLHPRREIALAAVLEGDLGRDGGLGRAAVERIDQRRIALGDEAAAHLLGARQLAVVGVELLVQNEEAPDLRAGGHRVGGERAVGLLDVLRDHVIDQRMAGELLVGAVDHVVALGPASDRGEIDVEHHRDEVAAVAVGHRLADVGKELQLVLDVLRREQRAVLELADILGAVDDLEMPGLAVEEPGVAGLDVAVGRHRLPGLGLVLEVADELARRLELHLPRVGDPDVDVGRGRTDGVGIDLAVRLAGHIEERFGLAVELLQVHAERAIEREQVRPDRLAGGVGDPDPREPEHVLERRIDHELTQPIQQPAVKRHRLAVEDRLAVAARDPDEVVEQLALDIARVLHPDHDAGQHGLERARRREIERRPDLAQILHRGFAALRTGRAEARDQLLRIVEVVVADPGDRQVGQRLVPVGQLVEGDGVAGGIDAALRGQHHALGLAGGAGRIEDDRGVRALAGRDLRIQPLPHRGILLQRGAAVGDHLLDRTQVGPVVVAQALVLVVDHGLELRQPRCHRHDLIDLLLVLDCGKTHLGMGQHERQLVRHRVGIDRHRDRAEHLRRHHRFVEPGPVRSDDGDGVAALDAEPAEANRIGADLIQHLRPAQGLPDAEILVPKRRAVRTQAGVLRQQLGKRVRRIGGIDRQDNLPLTARRRAARLVPSPLSRGVR